MATKIVILTSDTQAYGPDEILTMVEQINKADIVIDAQEEKVVKSTDGVKVEVL